MNRFKHFLALILIFASVLGLRAQDVPQAINFQAIARDANSEVMANTPIMIQLTILSGSPEGELVYREIRSLTTNAYGSFSFQIGRDPYMHVNEFADIDWAGDRKFLKIDYDPTATLSFNLSLGTVEFVSVPYAFAAGSVSYIDASNANDGDVLAYNAATGRFEPRAISGTGSSYSTPTLAAVLAEGNAANSQIKNVSDPTEAQDAATKAYVDALIAELREAIANGGGTTNPTGAPSVTTDNATELTSTTAHCGGVVTNQGDAYVTNRGLCWATHQNPTTADNILEIGSGTGVFSGTLTGLVEGTTYYVRAYAVNSASTGYGNEVSFVAPYTLTFNRNNGSGSMNVQYFTRDIAQPISANTFSRTYYEFTGWNTSADGTGTSYDDGQEITLTQSTTFYAQWQVATYTITFNANGGSGSMAQQSFTGGVSQALTANAFSRSGYSFAGWATSSNGNVVYADTRSITVSENMTLYAQWFNLGTNSNGYYYVDLGLSVKWASYNVGSSTPEGYGNYYAWGETTPYSGSYNYSDNPTTLPASADAAAVNWGEGWRMPTQTEMQELINNCTWTWTTLNGVNGYRVTGTNGNSIFLPAAGDRFDSELTSAGSDGYYWSSSLYADYPNNAWYLDFGSDNYGMSYCSRRYGHSVRPVCVSQN